MLPMHSRGADSRDSTTKSEESASAFNRLVVSLSQSMDTGSRRSFSAMLTSQLEIDGGRAL
jgi:hypothetical protein